MQGNPRILGLRHLTASQIGLGAYVRSMKTDPTNTAVTTFYNHACPVCRMEIEHYKRLSGDRSNLSWVDSSADKTVLARHGITGDDVLRRLYVLDTAGTLYGGVDAFIEVWKRMPRYRWLAKAVGWGPAYPVAVFVYDRMLAPALFSWNRRKGRLGPPPSEPGR